MAVIKSAGILLYKIDNLLKVFLIHPGGPFFKNKDEGFLGIPKGQINLGENFLAAGIREMKEETGIEVSGKEFISLGTVKQKNGKIVHAWACEGDWSGLLICKSWVTLENPARSGNFVKFAEVNRAGFFTVEEARKKMNAAQWAFVERLENILSKKEI